MKVCFIHNEKHREIELANAFCDGVERMGDSPEKAFKSSHIDTDAKVVCMVGVKSLKLFKEARAQDKHVIFFDKGYFRHRGVGRVWEYWRVAVNDHHPTAYLETARHSPERWNTISERRGIAFPGWKTNGDHIVYAGSSAKYHAFADLSPPTEYATEVVEAIRQRSNRLIIYRPKPSWKEAVPVPNASYSDNTENLSSLLPQTFCLVTAGSNACFDAVMNGVPCLVLGNGIAKPISSTSIEDIEHPRRASDAEVLQWLSNLAWCMFTEREMRYGLAWEVLKAQLRNRRYREDTLEHIALESLKAPSLVRAEVKAAAKAEADKKKLERKRGRRGNARKRKNAKASKK